MIQQIETYLHLSSFSMNSCGSEERGHCMVDVTMVRGTGEERGLRKTTTAVAKSGY